MKKTLLFVLIAAVLVGGGIAWKVLADRPAADIAGDPGSPNVILPAAYTPTEEEQTWIDSHTATAGVWVKKFGDYRFVLVTMGEKPTGGYGVEVADVAVSGNDWVVDVSFLAPGSGDIVTQALTYPYGFVKIKDDGNGLKVRDVTGGQETELAINQE